MSLSSKFTTVDDIIERVKRDYGFEEVHKVEVMEWVYDIIGYIGTKEALYLATAEVAIEEFKGILPLNFYALNEEAIIREKNMRIPLVYSSNLTAILDRSSVNNPVLYNEGESVVMDENDVVIEGTGLLAVIPTTMDYQQYTYKLNNDYIFTGFQEGTVEMEYYAFPIDQQGLPLVPDDPKFVRAVVSYVGERLSFRLMLKDELSHQKYETIKQDHLFNVSSARSKANMPSLAKMEAIKNRYLRINPLTTEFETAFKYSQNQEYFKDQK